MKTVEKQINENLSVHFFGELENVPEYCGDVEKTIPYVINPEWDKLIHTSAENELIVQWLKNRYNYESTIQLLTSLMLEDIEDEPRQPIQRPPAIYSNPQYYKL